MNLLDREKNFLFNHGYTFLLTQTSKKGTSSISGREFGRSHNPNVDEVAFRVAYSNKDLNKMCIGNV